MRIVNIEHEQISQILELSRIEARKKQEEEDEKFARIVQEMENKNLIAPKCISEIEPQHLHPSTTKPSITEVAKKPEKEVKKESSDDIIMDTILVIDTNIFLLEKDSDIVKALKKYSTFIPFAVIKELEKHKNSEYEKLKKYAIHISKVLEIEMKKKNKNIHIQEMIDLKNKCNDEEILKYAVAIAEKYKTKNVIFVTNYRALRLKAAAYQQILSVQDTIKNLI